VDFETDDRFVARQDFGRDAGQALLCQLRHKSRLVYHPFRSVDQPPKPHPKL
jgi:hypothetical protein